MVALSLEQEKKQHMAQFATSLPKIIVNTHNNITHILAHTFNAHNIHSCRLTEFNTTAVMQALDRGYLYTTASASRATCNAYIDRKFSKSR